MFAVYMFVGDMTAGAERASVPVTSPLVSAANINSLIGIVEMTFLASQQFALQF